MQPANHNCSITWAQAANGDPLICVAGSNAQIEVLNVSTQELVQVIIGHGKEVTDLVTSPIDPSIIASCSVDHSIRIWSLETEHREKPLAAIFHGAAHQGWVYSVAFHRKGRYLVSAGVDATICLWAIPDNVKGYAGTDKPITVHYPHFFTAEIHTDGIDCVQWYGDLILSKTAREDKIILWRIEGFNSDRNQVPAAPIPISNAVTSTTVVTTLANSTTNTRSAWGGRFQRLLQFDAPGMDEEMYMRFSVFSGEAHRPMLAVGNSKSKAFFWDLQSLEDAGVGEQQPESLQRDTLTSLFQLQEERESSTVSATESIKSGGQAENGTRAKSSKDKPRVSGYSGIGNPFRSITAHKAIDVPKVAYFKFRQFAWSNDGQWCVGVADHSYINIFHRNPQSSGEP